MKCWALALAPLTCAPAFGHVISMSTGTATVTGNRVGYILRMPDYEMPGAGDPANSLFGHIRFTSGFETGQRTDQECHHDRANSLWLCAADYQFSLPVEKLGVECSFYQVTVVNHIHVLRAERDGKTDRAILDSTFPSATLAFRPPTAFERAAEQGIAGAVRIWTGAAVLILLFALALAARTWLELSLSGLAFLTAQILSAQFSQPFPARVSEAAVALALAYLGLEMLLFPAAGGRWLMALIFGAFSGLYFATFLMDSGYVAGYVLTGAALAGVCVLLLCAAGVRLLRKFRAQQFAEGALFLGGCVWAVIRLAG